MAKGAAVGGIVGLSAGVAAPTWANGGIDINWNPGPAKLQLDGDFEWSTNTLLGNSELKGPGGLFIKFDSDDDIEIKRDGDWAPLGMCDNLKREIPAAMA